MANGIRDSYEEAIKGRMEVLERDIQRMKSQEDKIRIEREELQAELNALESAYPQWSSGSDTLPGFHGWISPAETVDLVVGLLQRKGKALHYKDMYSTLVKEGMPKLVGKTKPEYIFLSRFFNDARLERVGKGLYNLKDNQKPAQEEVQKL